MSEQPVAVAVAAPVQAVPATAAHLTAAGAVPASPEHAPTAAGGAGGDGGSTPTVALDADGRPACGEGEQRLVARGGVTFDVKGSGGFRASGGQVVKRGVAECKFTPSESGGARRTARPDLSESQRPFRSEVV